MLDYWRLNTVKKATFFFHLGSLSPGDRLFIYLKIRQFTDFLCSKIEKDYLFFSLNATKKFQRFRDVHRILLYLENIFWYDSYISSYSSHVQGCGQTGLQHTALGIPLGGSNPRVCKLGLKNRWNQSGRIN